MQIASSASRTCMASASAVECTATVLMPISWAARWMRSAISPRLAIRILRIAMALFDDDQGLVEFDRLAVVHQQGTDGAGRRRDDRIHHLHRFNDDQRVS